MTNNNMICDLETGLCGPSEKVEMQFIDLSVPEKKIELYKASHEQSPEPTDKSLHRAHKN